MSPVLCALDSSLSQDLLQNSSQTIQSRQTLLHILFNLPIHSTQEWRTLLHYGKHKSSIHKKSPFFLHKKGYKNPKSEYEETLQRLFAKNPNANVDSNADSNTKSLTKSSTSFVVDFNAKSIACVYPARMQAIKTYITQNANAYNINKAQLQLFDEMIDISKCNDLRDFLDIVPLENIFIEFAAESDIYPGSSMRHLGAFVFAFSRNYAKKHYKSF